MKTQKLLEIETTGTPSGNRCNEIRKYVPDMSCHQGIGIPLTDIYFGVYLLECQPSLKRGYLKACLTEWSEVN